MIHDAQQIDPNDPQNSPRHCSFGRHLPQIICPLKMSEDAEKRLERALDRLFSSSASSTAGDAASSREKGKVIPTRDDDRVGTRVNSTPRQGGRPPRVAGSSPSNAALPFNSQSVCRPWDRGDLFRRLATFKSMTWFGKPEEAGPVNCARKGWVNVDVDLISCEGCHAKLSFPSPTTWSQQQVESAAASFSEKLENAHKALCPWKGNSCSESLAQFPPTPAEVLMEGYRDRCDALFQLSTLPVVSKSAIGLLKISRGQQIDRLLAQSTPHVMLPVDMPINGAETGSCNYFQAQRIISLCGWEPRLLPYIVDCEDDSTLSAVRGSSIAAHDLAKVRMHSDLRPTVLLCSPAERVEQKGNKDTPLYTEQRSDVGSAVLDCNLCGASAGLWLFSQVSRPLVVMTSTQSADMMKTGSAPSACGFSAASGIEPGCSSDRERKGNIEKHDEAGEAVTSMLSKSASRAVALDLKLTIAGGPPPTQLSPHGLTPSKFSPIPFMKPGISMPGRNEIGNQLISNVLSDPKDHEHVTNSRITRLDSNKMGHSSLNKNAADKSKICFAESEQRELVGDLSPVLAGHGIEKEGECKRARKRTRNEHSIIEDLPRYSSVDAMDTCFHNRRENSIESVEMPEADSQGTTISGENSDHRQASGRYEKSPVSSKNDVVAKGEGNNNVSTRVKSSVSKKIIKTVDIEHGNNDGKCNQEIIAYHDEQNISRPVVEDMRKLEEASKTISEEERQDVEVIGGANQEVSLPADQEEIIGSANNVHCTESNSGNIRGKQEENEKTTVLSSEERMGGGAPVKLFMAEALPESSTGAMTASERIFDSEMVLEKEQKEFDPVLQHRHFCPWVNVTFRSRNDNQYRGMCGWQLTLDALEALPVIIESESASSIYNVDPLSSVRKILGTTQKSQKRSKNE